MQTNGGLHPDAPDELDGDPGELSDDAVTGSFRLLQRRRGHRYSLDDVITAWEAARSSPGAQTCLELGTGVGSVLHMLADRLPEARFVAIEAQEVSFRLLQRNVERNGLHGRCELIHDDLRARCASPLPGGPYDLITGTPPYVVPGTATPASDPQKSYARQEWRGGVEAYLQAASQQLAPHGRLVLCGDTRSPGRVRDALKNLPLRLFRQRDVIAREGNDSPLFSVFCLQHRTATPLSFEQMAPWIARNADGSRSADYLALRRYFGLESNPEEPPSP